MAVVGAAAAAQHGELAERTAQLTILLAKFYWIAIVQVQSRVKLGVAAP